MIPVQFITHKNDHIGYEDSARLALEGGCLWIQLRMKGFTDEEVEPVARQVQQACKEKGATFIIDDRVELVQKLGADGVHLGKDDMPVNEARELLGQGFIIGGTANTVDDIRRLKRLGADYVGCGPLRFTQTKERLAPVIGLEGYADIMRTVHEEGIRLPVCAIGGITLEDVVPLIRAGVDGIAVSGTVINAQDPRRMMEQLLTADEGCI